MTLLLPLFGDCVVYGDIYMGIKLTKVGFVMITFVYQLS